MNKCLTLYGGEQFSCFNFHYTHILSLSIYLSSHIMFQQWLILLWLRVKNYPNLLDHQNVINCRARADSLQVAVNVARIAKDKTVFIRLFNSLVNSQLFRAVKHFGCNLHYSWDVYTGCSRRNVRDFGRVFLMLYYTDITQNTYIQSWTFTEILAREVWNFDSSYSLIHYQIRIETSRNMWFL